MNIINLLLVLLLLLLGCILLLLLQWIRLYCVSLVTTATSFTCHYCYYYVPLLLMLLPLLLLPPPPLLLRLLLLPLYHHTTATTAAVTAATWLLPLTMSNTFTTAQTFEKKSHKRGSHSTLWHIKAVSQFSAKPGLCQSNREELPKICNKILLPCPMKKHSVVRLGRNSYTIHD